MSLKAKLEAVIYAAEEPVTLAQLAALFGDEALAWKAEQAAPHQHGAPETLVAPFSDLADGIAYVSPVPLVAPWTEDEPSPDPPPSSPGEQPEPIPGADQDQGQGSEAPTQAAEKRTAVKGTGFSPYINAAEPTRALAPEGGFSANSPAVPSFSAASTAPEPPAESTPPADTVAALEARRLAREARAILRQLLDELIASYASDGHGLEIREIAGGFRMATKPECHDAVRAFVRSLKPALKLSLPALETLAVIAYKQPVTAPEVNEIRGVDSSAVFGSLLARKLIATAGRKQVIGRPILYKTTREFLLRFGLKDVTELPSMEEFEKIAAMELDDPEPAHPDPSPRPPSDPALELDESAAEELPGEPPTHPSEAAPADLPTQEQAEIEAHPHAQES